MEFSSNKISNYVGQAREIEESKRLDTHLVLLDRDIATMWNKINDLVAAHDGDNVEDVNVGSTTLGTGASAPDNVTVSDTTIVLRGFDGNVTTEQLYGTIEIPHSFASGTSITPHVHWMATTNGAGNVKWQMEYAIAEDGGDAVGTSTTLTVSVSTTGIAWQGTRTDFAVITGTSLTYGRQILFRFFRNPSDAADTYGSDAAVLTVGFHYNQDTLGSYSVERK